MQILKDKIDPANLRVRTARPDDARKVVKLYREVYQNEYPCPELFTEQGMREFLTFGCSHTITSIVLLDCDVIAAGTFQIHGRVAYSRGWMVDPAWQGKIGTRQVFQRVLLQARQGLADKVDYFYGELRTASAKLQGIIEEIGFRPLAAFPRKDIFDGKRETEIIYAWYYRDPPLGSLRLTPCAARVVSAILNRAISPVDCHRLVFHPSKRKTIISYTHDKNGDGTLSVTISREAQLTALICYASKNSEKVVIRTSSPSAYYNVVRDFLQEIRERGIQYSEIYVPAVSLVYQAALENLGFSPTGFVPQWYAPGSNVPVDCVIYTIHFPSNLPDRLPEMTTFGQYLRPFITPPIMDASEALPLPEFEHRLASIQKPV